MERDFYYEPGMNGLDWPAMRREVRPDARAHAVVPAGHRVRHRGVDRRAGHRRTPTSPAAISAARRNRSGVGHAPARTSRSIPTPHTDESTGTGSRRSSRCPTGARDVRPAARGHRHPGAAPAITCSRWNGGSVTAGPRDLRVLPGSRRQVRWGSRRRHPVRRRVPRDRRRRRAANEYTLRYLDWIEHNRRFVDNYTGGATATSTCPIRSRDRPIDIPKVLLLADAQAGDDRRRPLQRRRPGSDIFLAASGQEDPGLLGPPLFARTRPRPGSSTDALLVCLTNRQAGSGGDEVPFLFPGEGDGAGHRHAHLGRPGRDLDVLRPDGRQLG